MLCVFKQGGLEEAKREESFKWKVNGRNSWNEFPEAVEEEFQGWKVWDKEMEVRVVGEELAERVWGEWKMRGCQQQEEGLGRTHLLPFNSF